MNFSATSGSTVRRMFAESSPNLRAGRHPETSKLTYRTIRATQAEAVMKLQLICQPLSEPEERLTKEDIRKPSEF